MPVYAKLADMFGRKPIMLFGIGLFLLGSILCGFAWSMPALIAFRAVQGLGAGAVQPMAITIAGDIYTVAERAKVQGYLASVWAISVGGRPDARRRVLRVPVAGAGSSSSTSRCACWPRGCSSATSTRRSSAASTGSTTSARPCSPAAMTPADPRRARGRPGLGVELAARASASSRVGAVLLVVFVARGAARRRAGAAAVGVLAAGCCSTTALVASASAPCSSA